VIVVDQIVKAFEDGRVRALDGVTFRVETGEFVALTGASGSGKSTLLNLVGGLDRPDGGTILVDGEPPRLGSATGFVFQAHLLIPTLTAVENVQIPLFGKLTRRERAERAAALLQEVGLADRLDARPTVLSGGERQRVAIARALANDPRLLLADEPTGALDWDTGVHVIELLQRLRETRGTTILLVTNDDQVAAFADRVLHLRDGLIRAATPRSVPA
jgi:putative ABC transport system ATP-binding protein